MTKIKKTPTSEQIVKSKLLNGKVTKVKNSETIPESPLIRKMQVKIFKTPLAPSVRKKQTEQEPPSVTPFLSKCTSTPLNGAYMTSSGRVVKPNVKYRVLGPPSPLSPILADIGNFQQRRDVNVTRRKHSFESDKENKSSSSGDNKSEQNPGNVQASHPSLDQSERRFPTKDLSLSLGCQPKVRIRSIASSMKIQTPKTVGKFNRRRSVGTRKIAMVSSDEEKQYRENNCSNLRVRLVRTPVKKMNEGTATFPQRRKTKTSESQNDNSLVKRLRGDWSSTTLDESSSLKPPIRRILSEGRLRKPLQMMRLQLTPLIEMSTASVPSSTIVSNKRMPCDEDYSSSEEFQSKDVHEEENSISAKRAPTWKDLSNKSIESPYVTPKRLSVRRKRGPNLAEVNSSEVSEIVDSAEPGENVSMVKRNLKDIDRDADDDRDSYEKGDKQMTNATPLNSEKDGEENVSTAVTIKIIGRQDPKENVPTRRTSGRQGRPTERAKSANELRLVNRSLSEVDQDADGGENKKARDSNEKEDKQKANATPLNLGKNVSTKRTRERRRKPSERAKSPNEPSSTAVGRNQSRSSPLKTVPSKAKVAKENADPALKSTELELNNSMEDLTAERPSKTSIARQSQKLSLNSRGKISSVSASVANQTSSSPERKQFDSSDVIEGKSKKSSSPTSTAEMSHKSMDGNQSIIPSFDLGSKSLLTRSQADADRRSEKGNQFTNLDSTVTGKPRSSPSRSENVANKSDLIEELLSSSNDDELNVITKNTTNFNLANNTNKFFHSRVAKTNAEPTPATTVKPTKRLSRGKKQKDQIYEFLSQSSSSDANDPVADVIQKMIKQGKVDVAKLKKGAGVSVVKRQAKRKRKAPANEPLDQKSILIGKKLLTKKKAVNTVHFDEDTHFGNDGMDFCEEESNKGGFSELARSAMLKEAGKSNNTPQRTRVTDRKSLLAMAQKIVGQSTPIRSPSQASGSTVRFSPAPGSSSPWRVDDDKLPSLFYFSRNSDNLPSFSSDHIPSTPTKNKSKSMSSFSSNDSNMENIAPPRVREVEYDSPASTARRGLSYRSPLKAINILEVVNLPPLAMKNITKDGQSLQASKSTVDASTVSQASVVDEHEDNASIVDPKAVSSREENRGFEDIIDEDKDKTKRVSNKETTDLFGFEDIIDEDEDNVTTNSNVVVNRENLKKKLEGLRRLRPETPVASTSKAAQIKSVFDENRPKQRTLQQMLCSTMIERQPQQHEDHGDYFNDGYDINLSNLFKDPEPETTFDESVSRRTYSRPFQRKRKLRNNFVMFMDSDASEDEEEAVEKEKKRSKKRQRKDPREEKELTEFVNEFNEMCKEVSQYELIVE